MRRIVPLFLFSFIFLITARVLLAQGNASPARTNYFTLKKARKDESLPGKINFSGVRFIDNRIDTTSIENRFLGTNLIKINLRDGMLSLNDYVKENYGEYLSGGRDSLLILVNDYRASPAPSPPFSQYMLVRMKLVLAQKNKSGITLLGTEDTVLAISTGMTLNYQKGVKRSIKQILLQAGALAEERRISAEKGKQPAPSEKLTEETFMDNYAKTNFVDYPILKESSLRPGIYQDFFQFAANAPQQEEALDETGVLEYETYNRRDFPVKIDSGRIWGYCDGQTAYIRTGYWGNFFPLSRYADHVDLAARQDPGLPARTKHHSTAVTILEVVAAVAVVVAVVYVTRNSGASSDLGSGYGGGSGGGSASYRMAPPPMLVDAGGKTFSVRATRIDMHTGKAVF